MGDDHGWDEVAYNGHPYLKTPILDEMASSGLRLDKILYGIAGLLSDKRQRYHRSPPKSIRNLYAELVNAS